MNVMDESDPGLLPISEEHDKPDTAASEAFAKLREVHELRGRLLSDMCEAEQIVDMCITVFFLREEAPLTPLFTSWVLAAVGFQDKIGIIEQIMGELSLKKKMPSLVAKLNATQEARNRQAHSAVTFNTDGVGGPAGEFLQWKLARPTRKGWRKYDADIESLNKDIDLVTALRWGLPRLLLAIVAVIDSKDIDKVLADFDVANPMAAMWGSTVP
jgi:hypothetical protein